MLIFKYVIIDNRTAHLFFAPTRHKDYKAMGNITSAAFVSIDDGDLTIHGEADSLGIGPGPQDATIIRASIKSQGGIL